jgi:hypothetical protein
MGVVYHAEQMLMNRPVAIKVISKTLLERSDTLERFQREVVAAAKLIHPNIVTAYDAERAGDLHMLVMEFVEGQSLDQVLRRRGPLPVVHACVYIRQAALGLQHAHEQRMVHRDIKPQNLMLTPKGRVKILDFGLAKLVSENRQQSALTALNAYMGTPDYSAPEQATDARKADIRADIYSLGCTLYCLLAGRPPFREQTAVQTILAHLEKEPPRLTALRSDIPEELWALVARMLAKQPAQRFQTPGEVAQALLPFCKGSAALTAAAAPPGSTPQSQATMAPGDTSPRPDGFPQGAETAPTRAPAGREGAFRALVEPPPPRKAPRSRSRKSNPPPGAWATRWPVLVGIAAVVLGLAGALVTVVVLGTPPPTAERRTALVVEIDQPGALVQVDGRAQEITVPGGNQPVEIPAEPGRHELLISKDGFEAVTRDVELKPGESNAFRVRLDPVKPTGGKPPELPGVGPRPLPDANGFVPLFNGRDLTGWKRHPQQPGRWHVENGVLTDSGPTGSMVYTERDDYENFHLRAEARVNLAGNSGIFFRSEFGPYIARSYEAEILGTSPNGRHTGTLYEWNPPTGFLHAAVADRPMTPDQWFRMEVIADGRHFTVRVDDRVVAETVVRPPGRSRGHIALQYFGPGTVTEFRKIEIKELPPTPRGPEAADPAPDRPWVSLFNGRDLAGWRTSPAQAPAWRVEKAVLTGTGPTTVPLYTARDDFENFYLRAEVRVGAGALSHLGTRSPFLLLKGKPPFEVKGVNIGGEMTGSVYMVFGKRLPQTREAGDKPGEWLTLEVIVRGNGVVTLMNGKTIAEIPDDDQPIIKGFPVFSWFLRQAGNPSEVEFRKIEIKELPATQPPRPATTQVKETCWQYRNTDKQLCEFRLIKDGFWIEDVVTESAVPLWTFKEVARNKDFVELFDESRTVGVRLYARQSFWKEPQRTKGQWARLWDGEWKK